MQRGDRKRAKHYRKTRRCIVSVVWNAEPTDNKHCSTHNASWVGNGPCPKRGSK